jgi:hypothetical protein
MRLPIVLTACAATLLMSTSFAAEREPPDIDQGPTAAVAWFTDAAIDGSVTMAAPDSAIPTAAGAYGRGIAPTSPVPLECPVLIQARGYISFWIKPNWNGNDGHTHRILRIGDPGANGLLVEKSPKNLLRFVVASPKKVTAARADVSTWKAGDWHHVVVVWEDFRDKPLGLPIWIDHKAVAGPIAADNDFLDPAAMDDARLWLGDETTDAVIDELIVRNRLSTKLSDRQISLVYRDYFRTAPYEAIRVDPEPLRVPADRRVVAGYRKQFGLEGRLAGTFEDMTDFVERYDNWGHFDAKPLITWSTSNPKIATVDENGLVTGVAVGRCTLTAEFRGMKAAYRLDVVPVDQPDLDLPWVERLPRYDWNARKHDPAPGDAVQSVAHVFNMGYKPVPAGAVVTFELFAETNGNYELDDAEARRPLATQTKTLEALDPRAETAVTFDWTWPEQPVWVRVTVDPRDRISEICEANNQISDLNTARGVVWAYEPDEVNKFLDERTMTLVGSFSVYDWDLAHVRRLNGMLREAVYPCTTPHGPDYAVRLDANIWRGDFLAGDRWGPYRDRKPQEQNDLKWWRGSWPHDEITFPLALESGIIHELGHTMLALPDLYGAPIDKNRCYLRDENGELYESGKLLPYIARHDILPRPSVAGFVPCGEGYASLMDFCTMWIDPANAAKIQYYSNLADRPFWGSQGTMVPGWRNWLYVTDVNDAPLVGAAVYVYQAAQNSMPFFGRQYFYDRPKFVGHTDGEGRFFFPKETDRNWDDPETDEIEGRIDLWNPFGKGKSSTAATPNCFGYDGLFLIKIVASDPVAGDQTEFHYLTLGDFNIAFVVNGAEGEYPLRTSLKPVDGRTHLVHTRVPEAIREQNKRPVAVVEQTALTAKVGEEFTLDGSKSYDPEGQELVLHEWQLDDGEAEPWRQAGAVITAKAKKPGRVKYVFFVNDGMRVSDPVDVIITVTEPETTDDTTEENAAKEAQ